MCCRDVVEEANKSGKIVKQAVAWTVNTLYAVWAQCAVLRDVWAPIVKTVKMGRGNVPLDALGGE